MGKIVPTMALTKTEFDKRVAAGAKTFAEIDPVFWNWHRSQMKQNRVMWIMLVAGAAVFTVAFIVGIIFQTPA